MRSTIASLEGSFPTPGTSTLRIAGAPTARVASATKASDPPAYGRPTVIDQSASRLETSTGRRSSQSSTPAARTLLRTASGTSISLTVSHQHRSRARRRLPGVRVLRTPEFAVAGFDHETRHATVGDDLRMAYVTAGPADGRPVLLLHGEPT